MSNSVKINDRRAPREEKTSYRGFYSCIQYRPDCFTNEGVVIGVVVICPELKLLKCRFTTDNARVLRLFGTKAPGSSWELTDWIDQLKSSEYAVLNRAGKQIKEAYPLYEERHLDHYIKTRANDVHYTELRGMRIEANEDTFNKDFEAFCRDSHVVGDFLPGK